MPDSREPKLPFRKLLWHGMMRITLGVIFAGLLLHSGALQADDFVDAPVGLLARLGILLTVACVFGIGTTLTGALFLVDENF
jgi:hypothetical protein